jgi:hypothetical protein
MGNLKPALNSFQLIELATKQGFEKTDINVSGTIIAIMYKILNKRLSINIYISLTGSHEFEVFIRDFGTIRPFKNYFKNIALFEKEAMQIYKNLTTKKWKLQTKKLA